MESLGDQVVLFRIAERLTLSVVVLIIAIVVMVGFWRSVQKLDVAEGGKLGIGGSFVFSTPVFVLLAIIGYAYVSLSHPISVAPGGADAQTAAAEAGQGAFVGASGTVTDNSDDAAYDLSIAERKVRSLNCIAEGQTLSPRLEDDLSSVKLAVLAPVWPAAWGSFDGFRDWSLGTSTQTPDADARAAFERLHIAC